jgi:hypothetical protein
MADKIATHRIDETDRLFEQGRDGGGGSYNGRYRDRVWTG